jgi:hypothetical protein
MDRLDEGAAVADAMPDLVLQGRFLDSRAALLCDRSDADLAVEPAIRAADIGIRTGNTALSRDANVTLALAYLQSGNLTDAPAAARAAVQQAPGARALAAWAVMGVVRFGTGDLDGARAAFHTACTEGWLRLERDTAEFAVHDALGIALTGLEVCGEPHRLWRALEAFAAARAIAPVRGARRRAVAQLDLFGRTVGREALRAARAAADGGTVPISSP